MSRAQRLLVVLVLNLALVASLIVVGVTAHSVAVLAEGGDYLLDALGAGVALLAIRLATRSLDRTGENRSPRLNSVAALINAGWLLLLELLVIGIAVNRLIAGPPRVDGLAVLVVSGVAAFVMAMGALVLRGGTGAEDDGAEDENLSVKAVLLDTVADSAAAAGVAATGGIILASGGWYWLDPVVALVIAAVVAGLAYRLIRKVISRLQPTGAAAGG